MLHIAQATTADDFATIRALLHEYQTQLGIDLCFQGFDAEVRDLPGTYAPPKGRLLLAARNGLAVGCVALRPEAGTRGEMKRLYVRASARGLGVGRALLARVLDEARAIGYAEVVLDTLPSMAEARNLYGRFGFSEIPAYCENPIAGTRYLGKRLLAP